MKLQAEVLYHLSYYWWLRCALVPLTLLNMSLSGIMQVNCRSWPAAVLQNMHMTALTACLLVCHVV